MESTVQYDDSVTVGGFLNSDHINTLLVTSQDAPAGAAKVVAYNRSKGVRVELLLTAMEVTGLCNSLNRCIQNRTNSVTSTKAAVAVKDSYSV